MSINIKNGRVTVTPLVNWYPAGDLERAVVFEPGYNDQGGQYGIHGMGIRWLVRGPMGATQFLMNTGWTPGLKGINPRVSDLYPMAFDLGYHAVNQQYDTQDARPCDYLDGRPCFYDGSGLNAEDVMNRFIVDGEPAIWRSLQDYYDEISSQRP